MNKKIRVTKEYEIETSECGEFCGKGCPQAYNGIKCSLDKAELGRTIFNNGTSLVRWYNRRTEFCKRNEVKADHYFMPSEKHKDFCARCGNYLTDEIHFRADE
jgi:hypothetical protein